MYSKLSLSVFTQNRQALILPPSSKSAWTKNCSSRIQAPLFGGLKGLVLSQFLLRVQILLTILIPLFKLLSNELCHELVLGHFVYCLYNGHLLMGLKQQADLQCLWKVKTCPSHWSPLHRWSRPFWSCSCGTRTGQAARRAGRWEWALGTDPAPRPAPR